MLMEQARVPDKICCLANQPPHRFVVSNGYILVDSCESSSEQGESADLSRGLVSVGSW